MLLYFVKANWIKGKIICPKCDGRIGSFNFTQPRKCACRKSVAQPVWLMKSKIDLITQPILQKSQPVVLDQTWTIIKDPVPDKLDSEYKLIVGNNERNDADVSTNKTDFEMESLIFESSSASKVDFQEMQSSSQR